MLEPPVQFIIFQYSQFSILQKNKILSMLDSKSNLVLSNLHISKTKICLVIRTMQLTKKWPLISITSLNKRKKKPKKKFIFDWTRLLFIHPQLSYQGSTFITYLVNSSDSPFPLPRGKLSGLCDYLNLQRIIDFDFFNISESKDH